LIRFDGVELHGANGYLIDTFLQSVSNQRTDHYGGSFENRYRFLDEVITKVKEVYPSDRIGVRLSPNGAFGGMGSEDNDKIFPYVAGRLSEHKLAYLHLMDGLGFGFHGKSAPVNLFTIKKHFDGVVIGNIAFTKDTAEGALRTGAADLIAFGRPYISNPDLAERLLNGYPLAEDAPYSAWYGGADPSIHSVGYTDFPTYIK
jgi:N-ethylmaleimide reductase